MGQRMSIVKKVVRYHRLGFVIAPCAKYGRICEVILCRVFKSSWVSSALKKKINVSDINKEKTKKKN